MKRQLYYPGRKGAQLLWLKNLRDKLPRYADRLKLSPDTLDEALADLAWLIYFKELLVASVRLHSLACSQAERDLTSGKGKNAVVVPPFTMPLPPENLQPVRPGALDRIFNLVVIIKLNRAYTEDIGIDLGIVGNLHRTAESPVPVFKLTIIPGSTGEAVRGKFSRFGHFGVYVETRRGDGDWERLGVFPGSTFRDDRPLLDPSRPEIREYRLRFWDDGVPNGEWTDVARVTVSP